MLLRLSIVMMALGLPLSTCGQLIHELGPTESAARGTNRYRDVKFFGEQVIAIGSTCIDAWDLNSGTIEWQIATRDNGDYSQTVPGSFWVSTHEIKFLESNRYETVIRSFDASRKERTAQTVKLPEFSINCAAWSKDGLSLALAGYLNDQPTIFLVDQENYRQCEPPESSITQMLFSDDGKYLFFSSDRGTNRVNLLDLAQGKIIRSSGTFIDQATCMALTADGQTLVVTGRANQENGISLLDANSMRPAERGRITSQKLLNDAHATFRVPQLFSKDALCAISCDDGSIVILDIASRSKVAELRGNRNTTTITISPDDQWLASIHNESQVSIWRWKDVLREQGPAQTIQSHFHGDRNPQLAFSPTQDILAVTCAAVPESDHYADSASVAGASQDDLAVSRSDANSPVVVVLIDTQQATARGTFSTTKINAQKIPSDTAQQVAKCQKLVKLAFSPDGRYLAAGGEQSQLMVWSLDSQLLEMVGPAYYPRDLMFDPNNEQIWVAGYDGLSRFDTSNDQSVQKYDDVQGNSIALTPDGSCLLLGLAAYEKTDLSKTIQASHSRSGEFLGLTCSPDGRFAFGFYNDSLIRWNLETGTTDEPFVLHREMSRLKIFDCDLSPNGQLIATSTADSKIRLWSTQTAELIVTLVGHEGPANSIEFSPDGKSLASAGFDGTTRLWDTSPFIDVSATERAATTTRKLPTNVTFQSNNGAIVNVIFDRPAESSDIEAALVEALTRLRQKSKR